MSRKHSARRHRIDVVLECLMKPAWELQALGPKDAPQCYVLHWVGLEQADIAPTGMIVRHEHWTRGNPKAKEDAKFHLKMLIAEQIVDALQSSQAPFADDRQGKL